MMRLLFAIPIILCAYTFQAQTDLVDEIHLAYEVSPNYTGQGDTLFTAMSCVHVAPGSVSELILLDLTHSTDSTKNISVQLTWEELADYLHIEHPDPDSDQETPLDTEHYDIPLGDVDQKNFSSLQIRVLENNQIIETHLLTIQ